MTPETAASALSLAHAAALREGREVRSIKDLLCDACGVAVALRDGLCIACSDSLSAHYDATTAQHSASTDDTGADGFALHCAAACDDAEGSNFLAGIRS